tara:strand:+ start:4810 stop:4998 length:189 start_codon:yes stop_codon:yes gene_type:complete
MDLIKRIEELKKNVEKFDQLSEDLGDRILSKQKKIDYLKEQIQLNVKKIEKIIKDYNADIKN